MISKKYLLLLVVLPILLLGLAATNVPVQSAFATPYVKIVCPNVPFPTTIGARIPFYPYIETNLPDATPSGIVAWGIYLQVNPDVLELTRVSGASGGYFLWEFADYEYLDYPVQYTFVDAAEGFADIAEYISPTPSIGAGDYYSGLNLFKMGAKSRNLTVGCRIDILNAEYMTPDGNWHQVDVIVDGWYGAEPGIQSAVGSGPIPIDLTDPIGTTWHELYPNYCHDWMLIDWTDNGDGSLSTSDQIEMENVTGWTTPYHVDVVTTTIHWTFKPDEVSPPAGDPAHAEPDETFPSRLADTMADPIGSVWHQIYPDYCRQFKITSWDDNSGDPDTDPNGVFDPSDQFDFVYEDEPGTTYWAHLDAVSTDIIISQKGPPEPPPAPEFPLGLTLMIAIAPAIPIVYLWRLRKKVVAK